MAQSLAKIYLHIIFSTKNRQSFIKPEIEIELHKYMAGILRNIDCTAIKISGISDHIHILNTMSRTISISKMLGILKKDSSKWLKTKGNEYKNFHWQNGYGVFSVGLLEVNEVKTYIENQYNHHRKKTFMEEYRELLKKYHMEYDERYVWD
jgi:REP element-mobilizing transposase RayT